MTTDPSIDPRAIAELHARITALEGWRTHQTDLLDDLLDNGPDPAYPDDPPPDDPVIDGDALITWVHHTIIAIIERPLRGEIRWCPRWWEHPEAVFRFAALHRAWTELAPEPGAAMSVWIRDHLDPCLRELLNPLGPFADCTHNTINRAINPDHEPLPTLPVDTPPGHR